jgi:hypothetical protein
MVNQIEDGEQTAMVGQRRCARLRVQPNPSRTEAFRGLETDRDQERYLDTVEVWRSSRHGPTTVFKGLPLPVATSHHRSFGYDGRTKPASASAAVDPGPNLSRRRATTGVFMLPYRVPF